MYNLDVVGNDNFFVGEKGWLVHNAESSCPTWIGVFLDTSIRKDVAGRIAGGHANVKHPEIFSGKIYSYEKADVVTDIMNEALKNGRVIRYSDGRVSFWNRSDTVIHFDPRSNDLGTVFQTSRGGGSKYWNELLNNPKVVGVGVPKL